MNKITQKTHAYLILALLAHVGVLPALADENPAYAGPEAAVSDAALAQESGQGLNPGTANLANNTISISSGGTLINGNNTIGDKAFSDVNGIPTVIQNSGNNVIVQTATQISVEFQK